MPYTVGSVPYLNARPLVAWFESLADASPVRVVYDLPSRLPALLDSGEADAILVSSIEALTTPNRTAASGVCIGSRGPAESVRLFSRASFAEIRSLALDRSSLTSNALARIVLAERFAVRPNVSLEAPDLQAMLRTHDAAVLIGDKGMMASAEGLNVLDLGQAWTELTGLPFVWALWVGGPGLTPELSLLLNQALDWAEKNSARVIEEAAARSHMDVETARRYLTRTMNFRLEREDLFGLCHFGELLVRHGLADDWNMPDLVPATKEALV